MGPVGGSTRTKHSSSASPTALGQRGNSDPEHIFHCQCLSTSSYSCYSWAQTAESFDETFARTHTGKKAGAEKTS
jgi:hypothetical protein